LSLGASVPSELSAVALYVVIGSLVFAEDALFVGFLLPGETAVLAGGVLASQAKLSLPAVLGVVIIAAIAGDLVGYQVGEHWGTKLIGSRRLHRYRKRLDDARELVRTHGGWAVFAGRWVAFLRATVPPICGLSHMPMRSFVPWNAFGALSWATVYTLIRLFRRRLLRGSRRQLRPRRRTRRPPRGAGRGRARPAAEKAPPQAAVRASALGARRSRFSDRLPLARRGSDGAG
jgi:membrane-associated protein